MLCSSPSCGASLAAFGGRLSDKTDPMERFDFQSSATWGIPDYSHYPLPKTRSDPSSEEWA